MRLASLKVLTAVGMSLSLAACSHHTESRHSHHGFKSAETDPFAGQGSPYYRGKSIPFAGGHYQVGQPYQVAGRWFTPHEQPGYEKTGTASWYGEAFHRRRTSNGEWFDMNTLTAAHATLPLPSYVLVTNLENNRQVVVRVNDRGPFVGDRVIDLSKRAADVLGYRMNGKTEVRVKLIGPAPTEDSMDHMLAMNDAAQRGASMRQLASMSDHIGAPPPRVAVASAELPRAPRAPQPPAFDPEPQMQPAQFTPPPPVPKAYVVRVGVFHSLENATAVYNRLEASGPTRIVKVVGANGPLYRVEMGPLENKSDADGALNTAIGSGFEDAKVVTTEPLQISMN